MLCYNFIQFFFLYFLVLNSWPKLLSLVPESCCLILAGLAVGLVFYMTNTAVLTPLSSAIFFFIMLPPIILDAGYFMPNRPFFDHLGTILLFAVVGTIFNTVCIGKTKCEFSAVCVYSNIGLRFKVSVFGHAVYPVSTVLKFLCWKHSYFHLLYLPSIP